jgi:hypothetical protein
MESYDPSKVKVSFGGIEWTGESELAEIKFPNITTTDMNTYPKDHPDYAEDIVRVDVREIRDDVGNILSASFKLKKGNPYLEEILALDPYDTTSIKSKKLGE